MIALLASVTVPLASCLFFIKQGNTGLQLYRFILHCSSQCMSSPVLLLTRLCRKGRVLCFRRGRGPLRYSLEELVITGSLNQPLMIVSHTIYVCVIMPN